MVQPIVETQTANTNQPVYQHGSQILKIFTGYINFFDRHKYNINIEIFWYVTWDKKLNLYNIILIMVKIRIKSHLLIDNFLNINILHDEVLCGKPLGFQLQKIM